MKIDVGTVKGFEDYLPPASLKRKAIVGTAEKFFELYGFVPIETPVIEYDELMSPENLPNEQEDEAISDRFRLKDRGNRSLGLRYEFTFQLSRIFKLNPTIKLPFKRYQIGPVFRDEPLRKGRTRQFTQCDIDIIGDSSVNADAECLSVMSDILKSLNVNNIEIQVNNRKLLNAIIESVEISDKKQVMRELDKIYKVGEDEVKTNLKKYTSANQVITLFKLMAKPLDFFIENAFEGAEELSLLIEKCKNYGIKVKFNPFMIRGFGYYTGNIFEISTEKGSIMGGGRYDKAIGKFIGREIPAVGISFSLESISALCEEEISKLEIQSIPKTLVISLEQDKEAIALAKKLRKENISCSLVFNNLGKQLEYANSLKIPFVIFVGQEEIQSKKFKLKDMTSGEQKALTETQLIKKLSK